VPDTAKTEEVWDMEVYLRTLLSQVDSSLADEWERMRDPSYRPLGAGAGRGTALRPPAAAAGPPDVTADRKVFTAAVRNRIFTVLRAWSIGNAPGALGALDAETDADEAAWTAERLKAALDTYRADHDGPRFDPEARNLRHTYVTPDAGGTAWRVQQMLVDVDGHNDWAAEFAVDLVVSRAAAKPVVQLLRLGPLAP
jgi:hypothetical protein